MNEERKVIANFYEENLRNYDIILPKKLKRPNTFGICSLLELIKEMNFLHIWVKMELQLSFIIQYLHISKNVMQRRIWGNFRLQKKSAPK